MHPFCVFIVANSCVYVKYKLNIDKRMVYPIRTTSIKNVGLSEPKRNGAEHTSAVSVNLSLH